MFSAATGEHANGSRLHFRKIKQPEWAAASAAQTHQVRIAVAAHDAEVEVARLRRRADRSDDAHVAPGGARPITARRSWDGGARRTARGPHARTGQITAALRE